MVRSYRNTAMQPCRALRIVRSGKDYYCKDINNFWINVEQLLYSTGQCEKLTSYGYWSFSNNAQAFLISKLFNLISYNCAVNYYLLGDPEVTANLYYKFCVSMLGRLRDLQYIFAVTQYQFLYSTGVKLLVLKFQSQLTSFSQL